MEAFLERFYDEVEDNLADPRNQKRLTRAQRYRDLCSIQQIIFERLLNLTGQESELGKVTVDFAIVAEQSRYMLPAGFRNFLSLELWDGTGSARTLLSRMRSLDTYDTGQGIRILDGQRGAEIYPVPDSTVAGTWELTFRRGPVRLHYATATSVAAGTIRTGTPATDCGELVKAEGYYVGALVRIVSSAGTPASAEQVREITASEYDAGSGQVDLTLHLDLDPVPTGATVYEILPELPHYLDSLYAMDVAIRNSRRFGPLRAGLRDERHELWKSAAAYFKENVSDRAPERSRPPRDWEQDPWD